MSTGEATIQWLEAAGDRLSAILIKETRQALKSRQFVATFMLMLGVSWLISAFGIIFSGASIEYRETGREFFLPYYMVLAVANFIIVPYAAYRSLLNERDLNTFDLPSITTLSPRRIVWGKLQSCLVQLFIYYSAIAPFIAFTYCLNGITMTTIAFVLAVTFRMSVHTAMFALMLSTFARQRQTQVLLSLVLLGGLLWVFSTSLMFVGMSLQDEFSFDDAGFWWAAVVALSYLIPFFILFLQVATAQLTFEAGNRSTGIRVTCSAIFWITLGWIGLPFLVTYYHLVPVSWGLGASAVAWPPNQIYFVTNLLSLWMGLIGLFAATEDEQFSHRVRRDLPRRGLIRFVCLPFLPGGGRGFLYILLHLAVLWLVTLYAMQFLAGHATDSKYLAAAAFRYYVIFYLGLGAWLGRLLRSISSDIRAPHTRVLPVFVIAGGSILPHLLQLWDMLAATRYPLLFVTDPFSTTFAVDEGTASGWTILVLQLMALFGLLLNLPAIWRGVRETLLPEAAKHREMVALELPLVLDH